MFLSFFFGDFVGLQVSMCASTHVDIKATHSFVGDTLFCDTFRAFVVQHQAASILPGVSPIFLHIYPPTCNAT